MKLIQIVTCVMLIGLLVWLNQISLPQNAARYGGLTWIGWASLLLVGAASGLFVIITDSARAFGFFRRRDEKAIPPLQVRTLDAAELRELGVDKYRGPSYPHPVIFPERCIGCQACVDACPHDVLAIVDGTAAAIAPDLCMEDTACQAECPVNPKACIVINTAKEVRSMPTPTRDGGTYETNVPGCYIIGDVSGVPLIKNAVKEGADVIAKIAADLSAAPQEPKAEYDVAIIGIGPGGASAAATAKAHQLRYVGIEQDKILSTIELYPKGKYIFFKPDTKDWFGGIPVAGLGLAKAKYAVESVDDSQALVDAIGGDALTFVREQASAVKQLLLQRIPTALHAEVSEVLSTKAEKEIVKRLGLFLHSKGQSDWPAVFRSHVVPNRERLGAEFQQDVVSQLSAKIPGDQRENILAVWLGSLAERGVKVNEQESCKSVTRAPDGDYFVITTERAPDKSPQTYRARRVIIAIGLRGAPNKLRLPNEDMRVTLDGVEQQKVIYGLSNPMDFRGKNIIVVGGGNVAVEAAVDLVAVREGAAISPRRPEDMNRVTVLVRDYLAPTVKFGNKFQLYQCAEDGIIDLKFGVGIKEMRENEVVIENVTTKEIAGTIKNDLIFALIGGERPNRFLESIGITIK